jgi:hypothetical protein
LGIQSLLNVPKDPIGWSYFSFNNRDSHDAIAAAILTQKNIRLNRYELEPLNPQDLAGWLQRHSQTHNEQNAALKTQGQDLQDVNLRDEKQLVAWIWDHYLEHSVLHQALGI